MFEIIFCERMVNVLSRSSSSGGSGRASCRRRDGANGFLDEGVEVEQFACYGEGDVERGIRFAANLVAELLVGAGVLEQVEEDGAESDGGRVTPGEDVAEGVGVELAHW